MTVAAIASHTVQAQPSAMTPIHTERKFPVASLASSSFTMLSNIVAFRCRLGYYNFTVTTQVLSRKLNASERIPLPLQLVALMPNGIF